MKDEDSDSTISIDNDDDDKIDDLSWNKHPNLKILSISINQNKTLLVMGTNYGYRIFDMQNEFKLISIVDQHQKELGPLKRVKLLYKSQLIGFLSTNDNNRFKENCFYFYLDDFQKIISKLTFKHKILNFELSSSLLFICFLSNILVFELNTMKFVHNIKYCYYNEKIFSIIEDPFNLSNKKETIINSDETKIITICYVSSYRNEIKLQRYITYKNETLYVIKDSIKTKFKNCPSYINLFNDSKLVIVSHNGNKMHIYDYVNKKLLICLFLGILNFNIIKIDYDIKKKFLLIYYNLNQLDLYKIRDKKNPNKKFECQCNEHPDDEHELEKRTIFECENSDYFPNYEGTLEPFGHGNIIHKKDVLFFNCEFDQKKKDIINLVNNKGTLVSYKFNRKEQGEIFKSERTEELI